MFNNNIKNIGFISDHLKEAKIFFVIFYTVGVIALQIPLIRTLFIKLIPFALILSFLGLVFFHSGKIDKKSIFIFFSIYFSGIVIEAIGVNTGLIFGTYQYGASLGFKIFNTPLIIGINWLLLTYTTSSVFEKINIPVSLKIVSASLIMLIYDIVLEQLAPVLDMWTWANNRIPIQNYVAWFFIAAFFHIIIKSAGIKTNSKLAALILICQFLFFLSLLLFII